MNYLGIDFKWELNNDEKKFVKYLLENGFEIIKHNQYLSKLKLRVKKDNVEMAYELSKDVSDMKNFIKLFNRSWELSKKIYELEREKEN